MNKVLVVTGCDAAHHALASDLVASLRAARGAGVTIGFIHVGAGATPPEIESAVDLIVRLDDDPVEAPERRGYRFAHMIVKPRVPELFPGFDTYIWLDGDTWVQNPVALDEIAHCAQLADIAIAPEADPNYFNRQVPDPHTVAVYRDIFGAEETNRHIHFTMLNAGVFGARAQSPVWGLWKQLLTDIRQRGRERGSGFFSDQIPLHWLISSGRLSVYPLRAVNNWLVYHAAPAINFERKRLLAATFPHEEIRIIHLVASSKDARYKLGDSGRDISFRYREIKALFDDPSPGPNGP